MPKRVLVIISTYNGESYIAEQLDSIINQKCNASVSIVIRDDGSTDSTCTIVKSYINHFPGKIELIEGNNIGSNASYFYLINHVNGFDYYAISDQDDVWMEDKLRTAIEHIESCNSDEAVLYASPSYLVYNDLVPHGMTRKLNIDMTFFNTIIQNICPGHNQVMNRHLFELLKKAEVDTSKIYVFDSWISNVAMISGKIIFDNIPHAFYRQHRGNQLGAGGNALSQFLLCIKRANKGDCKKQTKQIAYFASVYQKELLDLGFWDEINRFIHANGFFDRFAYIISSKLHRQKKYETVAFKIAYIFGKY